MNRLGAVVSVDSPIGTVTGGWYREKELSIDVRVSPYEDIFEDGDFWTYQLGSEPTTEGTKFSGTKLRETVLRNLTPNRFAVDVNNPNYDFQSVLDNAEIGKSYTITGSTY